MVVSPVFRRPKLEGGVSDVEGVEGYEDEGGREDPAAVAGQGVGDGTVTG